MERGNNQKLKLLYLVDILMNETDEDHAITMNEIISKLEALDVSAERKAIYSDLSALEDYGLDIVKYQEGRNFYYKVVSRTFELPELKLLVDSVQCAKFITAKKSNELIGKLEGLSSKHDAKYLQRQVLVSQRNKTDNEKIYYNVDRIHNAINSNSSISFQYFQWDTKKDMVLKHDGALYEVSPWALSWDDENYYMIGFDSQSELIKHYRVDKMLNISVTGHPRLGIDYFKKIDVANYTKSVFGMFGGEECSVRLQCDNSMAGVIIDRFGRDVMIVPKADNSFVVNVNVVPSEQFFGWVMAFGGKIKIIGPEKIVENMKNTIKHLYNQYFIV